MTPRRHRSVSYEGEVYTKKDVETLWKQLLRYQTWAVSMLEG